MKLINCFNVSYFNISCLFKLVCLGNFFFGKNVSHFPPYLVQWKMFSAFEISSTIPLFPHPLSFIFAPKTTTITAINVVTAWSSCQLDWIANEGRNSRFEFLILSAYWHLWFSLDIWQLRAQLVHIKSSVSYKLAISR